MAESVRVSPQWGAGPFFCLRGDRGQGVQLLDEDGVPLEAMGGGLYLTGLPVIALANYEWHNADAFRKHLVFL